MLDQQPLCIQLPETGTGFELMLGLIHLLPKFHRLSGEDPKIYLTEFHVFCATIKPDGVTKEQIALRAFLFSLADSAKEWLYYLSSGSVTTLETRSFGIRAMIWHPTDMCPTLQFDTVEKANAI